MRITQGGWELLDRVEPLWNQQRDFHFNLAPQWKQGMTWAFADRRRTLIAKGVAGHVIAVASINSQDVGYGISTVMAEGRAELDSLFVAPQFRSQGIGDALLQVTLGWFAERAIDDVAIELLACNKGALRFYARYGYQPRSIVMKRPLQQ
ncbi:GNAT family N-acetyltransferase [Anatilimnocola sp. NA78]|uniref:GNAT family N-acetyltransferase n=1 Tax=Anatilimnocola sp. NA78 TaxID=3415683 RepID=UPI003CE46B45